MYTFFPAGGPPAFTSNAEAALYWLKFGLQVIPVVPGQKYTAVKWDPWLDGLSGEKVSAHWAAHPDHDVGVIVGDGLMVLDADGPESIAALDYIELMYGYLPKMIIKTKKGVHHYYRLGPGVHAKQDSHSTLKYPSRIDVKTGRGLTVLPPGTGKMIQRLEVEHAGGLPEVSQTFVDAIFAHNGRLPPRPAEGAVGKPPDAPKPTGQSPAHLSLLLDAIEPDIGYEDWLHVLMAVHHETQGSDAGLALVDAWSATGKKYKGTGDVRAKWQSFKVGSEPTFTVALLRRLVAERGLDWTELCSAVESQFAVVDGPAGEVHPLEKYSLKGRLAELEAQAVAQVPLLGDIALRGQGTAIYAKPNTGKTLLVMRLLIDAIRAERIDPSTVYYVDVDDTQQGLVEKLRIAEEYGFHMVTDGQQGFDARALPTLLEKITSCEKANVLVILDTVKKVADLMDKGATRHFTGIVRRFLLQGGTLVGLAHANKNPGRDGKIVYGGVSDLVDDLDCVYCLSALEGEGAANERVVVFENLKRRGHVANRVAYGYSNQSGISYEELLSSVRAVDNDTLVVLQQEHERKSDQDIIAAIRDCIAAGYCSKMKLQDEAAVRSKVSQRTALQVIDKYTGSDLATHHWNYNVQAKGAKVYYLLQPLSPSPVGADPKPA